MSTAPSIKDDALDHQEREQPGHHQGPEVWPGRGGGGGGQRDDIISVINGFTPTETTAHINSYRVIHTGVKLPRKRSTDW